MWYVFEGALEPWNPKPIPKLWDLGQTKAYQPQLMSRNSEPSTVCLPDILSTWVFFVILVIPRALPGPLEVGYIASSGNDGLSSPCGVAYSELPEPCCLVKDEPAGGHEMTLPETNSKSTRKK